MILIQQLTDSDLLQVYTTSCRALALAKQQGSAIYSTDGQHVPLEELQLDHDQIMREVNRRLPYRWDVNHIINRTPPTHGIKPGNVYKHVLMPKVQIQIVEDDNNQYSCRLYAHSFYLCRVILKQSTILEHFSRLS